MEALLVITLAIFGFGIFSERLQATIISAPMVFVAVGILISPEVLGLVELHAENELIVMLAEFTLVIILFTDASRIDLRLLRKEYHLAMRMLAIGLPLTIAFGALVASVIFDQLEFWEAAVLAAVLAPTDAALGQAVVSSPIVPTHIRQTLNVESGLNDGIALPVVSIFLALAGLAEERESFSHYAQFTGEQIILGPIVGIVVGYVGGRLLRRAVQHMSINESFQQIGGVAIALMAFALAGVVGGNGFIAAFAAGLTVGNTIRDACKHMYEFAEAEGQLFALLTFLAFGATMVPPALEVMDGSTILYALLSLTVIRMIPTFLSLLGTDIRWETHLFLGWFGPRGIASILFGLLVIEEADIYGRDDIFAIMVVTVLISIFAHGITAVPATRMYGKRMQALQQEERQSMEFMPVAEMPLRITRTVDYNSINFDDL